MEIRKIVLLAEPETVAVGIAVAAAVAGIPLAQIVAVVVAKARRNCHLR